MIKGNKGEWSEFYAFLKILTDRKLFAADENLEIIQDKFYLVLKVIREEAKNGRKIYNISDNDTDIKILDSGGNQIAVVEGRRIKSKIADIFSQMKNSEGTTFEIELAEEAMQDLHCTQIKAGNDRKADIIAVIHDRISPTTPELGFSVKSMLGGASTLLNASKATNFNYIVDNFNGNPSEINSIQGSSKVIERIREIERRGGKMVFESVENETFKRNLRKIDTVLPDILAELVKAFFEDKGKTIPELVDALTENELLKNKYGFEKTDYEYKLKNFLVAIALGMTPSHEWDGLTQAHGGYIVVKENGDIICYHLYNRDEFQKYLYRNTKLETASTGRHEFATLEERDGKKYMKLNLQIRFIK